jgi:uncharacterized protein YdhG (YjbR/CyaY superfamily)
MNEKKKPKIIDEYIESQPEDTQKTLLTLRAIIMKAVPDATELFNYDMPAYALVKDGKRDKQIMIADTRPLLGFTPVPAFWSIFQKNWQATKLEKPPCSSPITSLCPRL